MDLKTFIKWLRRIIISGFVFMIVVYGVSYIIEAPDLGQGHYIKMYDQNNQLYYQSNQQSNDIQLKDVSQDFLKSIVAIEDHRFYKHRGFDPIGILRAVKANIVDGGKSEGASTITQQYARLMFLTNEKTWSRKINEAFLTTRLEAHYDKDTILQGYINTVYFGHGIYGIKNASHYYFNKEPKDLDLNESTLLAGVVNGPEYYSPFKDMEGAKARQKLVLNQLVKEKYITQDKANQISKTPFQLNQNRSSTLICAYPYYKDTVIQELKELGFYQENYINQGLNIQTTLNPSIQDQLNQTIEKEMNERDELEVSSIILDSHQASVLAVVGGKDYATSQFNRATSASRQIGSTMKPLLYYTAIENGFTPTTKFKSEPTQFKMDSGKQYSPTNFNQKYAYKDITLAQAIAVSDNIYAVKTHMFLGEQTLVNALSQFGFKHISPHPSLALGTLNTNIYELSSIYSTFANVGKYNDVHTITKITNNDGDVLYKYKAKEQQLLNQESTLILNQLLTAPFHSQFNTYASATMSSYQTKTTFAAKTGSTSYDSLCAGYNPNYTILSWTGYDDNRDMNMSSDTKIPKVIFQTMANFLQKEEEWYQPTDKLQQIPINPITGDFQENGLVYWFRNT
ncbi:transglycosylase domain-containing protein [Candidatus Stoquefichus massiliensis]|uniref:transglycosylase domain-containing protein n=1 Tax=Candidatus Stoquefichus massiliensis TaxID=1470350 RepID=UPI0005CA0CDB|nr:PBP1A family penicillin-binding protein [Candidatus Stoquefichus massiliensis]